MSSVRFYSLSVLGLTFLVLGTSLLPGLALASRREPVRALLEQGSCAAPYANEIVGENCLPGNPPDEWDITGAGNPSIQGFTTDISAAQGATVTFKVDTPSTNYRLDIYRMGYYGGLGARKVATVEPTATLPQTQPACLTDAGTGLIDCGNWAVSASWAVPTDAVSGIYFAKLVREDSAGASHVFFIVRDDDGASDILFQASDTTWHAYNEYGGNSLYVGSAATPPANRAYKVSYNRPFNTRTVANGQDWVFNAEYPMVRWLESNGYDVSYFTGVDSDRFGNELLEHKLFLSVGHDEYWSAAQRANVEAARAAGKHLAFFSGNQIFWKTRWETSIDGSGTPYRTLVSYKETHAGAKIDPEPVWTGTWRDVRPFNPEGPKPENALSGQIFMVNSGSAPLLVPYAEGRMRIWRNTAAAALSPGSPPLESTANVIGYEWDESLDNSARPPGLFHLSNRTVTGVEYLQDNGSTYAIGTALHRLSLYRHSSGALVFGAGTIQWSWGLDGNHDNGNAPADAFIQQATVNLFADMGVQPVTLQAGLTPATASTDTVAPTSTIVTPADGATVQAGLITVNGTATDVGGVVGGVEVSVDGGTTWRAASGRESWSYTWTPTGPGSVTLKSRAVDDSGNLETPGAGIQVTIAPRTCPCSIWEGTETPAVPDANDNQPIEVGVKFRADVEGYITGLRFYNGSQNTGTHVGHLWDSAGNQLAAATFTGETASGWQQVALDQPVAITAGTPYVASYHSSGGGYAYTVGGFDTAVVNAPLRALANGEDGPNGVYKYGASGFPTSTYNGSNYWVDVVFATTVGPDTTPPTVVALAPAAGASGVSPAASISADFSEPLAAASVSGATFELRDNSNALVPATVTYLAPQRRMQLKPDSALAHSTTYTARIVGGSGGVTDVAGNALAADRTWSFTTAAPPPPPPDEGPGGPILVIASAANPFNRYYAEILRAEGLNSFMVRDISLIDAAFLGDYQVAILGEMALSSPQVAMLTDWVEAGGNLLAMRPAAGLAPLLGLNAAGGTLANGYFLVDTSAAPGAGIVGQTMQFHGDASLYTLNGATAVAMLYSNATTATGNPAVTQRSVGSAGGQAASFAFDLARSVVLTRQGNPAWQGQNRDGQDGPTRSDDMFYGNYSPDPQPDWVNLDKVAIPQADEAQRLLANLITGMAADRLPLPRFWYFPRGEKAVVVMTHDDHGSGDIVGRLNSYNTASPTGCSVDDWECVRSTTYAYVSSQMSDAQIASFKAQGHEVVIHVTTGCADFTPQSLRDDYNRDITAFATTFPSAGPPLTQRTHCIAFSDWDSQPTVQLENGIRLDVNYYFWPPAWVQDRPGLFTGSGIPMRFARVDGTMIDVYQATTQMTDESGQSYPYTIDTLLDRALGPEGYYGAFVNNLHADGGANAANAAAATVTSAKARGVPIISAGQLLTWLDGRNGSSFANISYAGDTLTFDVRVGAGANGLTALLPAASGAKTLQALSRAGSAVPFTVSTINGVAYAQFEAAPGTYSATFGDDTTAPTVVAVTPPDAATGVAAGTAVTVQFSEPMNPAPLTGGGFELRDPSNALVAATVAYNGVTATLTPSAPLAPGTQYTARILTSVTDAAGNALTTAYAWSFTTAAGATCPCSIWPTSATPENPVVADDGAIELGVKFRSSTAGYITGIRFHRGTTVAGPFAATLWSSTGTRLATATLGSVTTAGWQEVLFANPVAIAANTTYVASYFVPANARYPATPAYFATSGTTNPPLTALQSGVDGPNGVYKYDTASSFPTDSFNNTNYWVDVVFAYPDSTPPAISARTPAPGATGVALGVDVTVQFNEPMNAATIDATTIRLRASGAGSDVAAAITYDAGTRTATLNPDGDLALDTDYEVTVAGSVADAGNNPLGADVTWTFRTVPAPPLLDDTVADFAAGTPGACYVSQTADGEIILSPTVGTEFSGTTQPDGWGAVPWTGGSATFNGSAATVDGARLATDASFTQGRSLEFVATFGAATFQHVGFGQLLENIAGEYWAMFGTWSATNTLYARTNVNGSVADIALAGNWIGSAHRFRIDWTAGAVVFSIDGSVVHTQNVTIEAPMRPVISDYQSGGPAVVIDWLRMTPYATSCTFTSRVLDRGSAADWLTLTSTGERPPGATATFETRSGDSALPDESWSGWQAVGAGDVIGSPDSRYIQYRVTLATSNAAGTPVVADVSITSGAVLGARIEGAIRYWYANEPVAGATLALTGGAGRSATSAPDGSYAFAGVPGGAWTLTASKSDEVRGVTSNDAALVLQHTVGSITLAGPAALAADVTQAGGISSLDASSILQVSVGAATLPAPWSFLPPAIAYPALAGDQLGQDFTAVLLGDVTGNWAAAAPAGAAVEVAAATPAAVLLLEARPVADGIHDLVFALAYSGDPIYSVDLVLRYDLARLEVLSAEVPPRPGQLSAINLADPGVVRIGLAGSVALPQDALVATVRVRSAGDPLAALTSVNAAADEQPLEVLLSGQESFRLYLPVVQVPFRLYLPVVTRR